MFHISYWVVKKTDCNSMVVWQKQKHIYAVLGKACNTTFTVYVLTSVWVYVCKICITFGKVSCVQLIFYFNYYHFQLCISWLISFNKINSRSRFLVILFFIKSIIVLVLDAKCVLSLDITFSIVLNVHLDRYFYFHKFY